VDGPAHGRASPQTRRALRPGERSDPAGAQTLLSGLYLILCGWSAAEPSSL
jgi:hypothetical protein